MKSYEEHIYVLLDFVNEHKNLTMNGFTKNEALHYLGFSVGFVSDLVTAACNKNKRIHSCNIDESIEEISAIWEVCQ